MHESHADVQSLENFLRRFRPVFAQAHGMARRTDCGIPTDADLETWCRTYLPEYFTRSPSLMHRWLFRTLNRFSLRRGNRLNLLAPRGNAKSTIGTLAYPLRVALEGTEPYIWIVSDTQDQAQQHLENLRVALDSSTGLKNRYLSALNGRIRYRAGRLLLPNGVRLEAYGTGQKLRGRRHGAHRPSLIIADDLQNDAHCRSLQLRHASRDWFFSTLLKAGNARTNVIHLATALHRDALALELTRTPGWNSRLFRAIIRYPDRMDLWDEWENLYMNENFDENSSRVVKMNFSASPSERFYRENQLEMLAGAVVLWQEEEDLLTLMKMRAESGKSAFEREKQNSPINPDLCEWEEKYFDRENLWFDEFPPERRLTVLALDPSKGRHANRGDYSAYVILVLGADGELYVDAELIRLPIDEMVETGIRLYRTFRPDAFGVEGNQFQDLLADFFRQRFQKHRLPAVQPSLIFNTVAKDVRLRRLGPWLAAGKLHFRRNSPGATLLVDQLRQFPIGDHDDGPDALEMAIRLMNEQLGTATFSDGLGNNLFH